jgi:alpha-N-arabinofuranosidase
MRDEKNVTCQRRMMNRLHVALAFLSLANWASAVEVEVDVTSIIRPVSPYLTGVNTTLHRDTDGIHADPFVSDHLRDIGTGLMRWPGGNTLDTYHWEMPGIQVWKDGWETDPESPYYAKPDERDFQEYMNIDEYLDHCAAVGSEPILGVNIESGVRYDRVQDSIDETIRLMNYCIARGVDVKYWYFGNEYYGFSSSLTADLLNQFVPAMKAVNPDIKIIINPTVQVGNDTTWTKVTEILASAGEHVDYVDIHLYWAWSTGDRANWEKFLSQNPLSVSGPGGIAAINQKFADAGYGHVKIVSMEWNVGQSYAPWSAYKISLVNAEMLMQFMEGGLDIANRWPRYNSSLSPSIRGLFNDAGTATRPAYEVMKFVSNALNHNVVSTTSDAVALPVTSVMSDDGTLFVYLLNKYGTNQTVHLSVNSPIRTAEAQINLPRNDNIDSDKSDLAPLAVMYDATSASLTLPAYTFAMATLSLAPDAAVYLLSAAAGANGSVDPAGERSVVEGGGQTYSIMPDPGYIIEDVLVDSVSVGAVSSYSFTDVTTNHTLSASFIEDPDAVYYSLTAVAGANGSINPAGEVSVLEGFGQTFSITADSGYAIQDVQVDGISVGAVSSYSFTDVTTNHTLSASFVKLPEPGDPVPVSITNEMGGLPQQFFRIIAE